MRTQCPEGNRVTRFCGNPPFLCTLLLVLIVIGSALVPARAAAEDTLILTDGVRTGSVEEYSGDICRFDGTAILRSSIYFIGLDAELPPPAPQDGMRDEVHLRDGSVHQGSLISIDATDVVTEGAVHPRKQVSWIWLTPMQQGAGQGTTPAAPPDATGGARGRNSIYEWEGTIRVENQYSGKMGRHRWRAEYRVKLLEVQSGTSPIINLEPQQINYEIQADHAYEIMWAADDFRSLTMLGAARGRLTTTDFAGNRYLIGKIVTLDEPLAAPHQPPRSFASYSDQFMPYFKDALFRIESEPEPGRYFLELRFREHLYARARALYDGIRRGGTLPPVVSDPDQEFLEHVPAWMPDHTYLAGRIDQPEQKEVRGAFTLSLEASWLDAPQEIAVEWHFARTRQ
jgi:hypothetical protein